MSPIRIATRRSPLALAQTELVAQRLRELSARDVVCVPIVSAGDTDQRALTQIGGTGVFVASVREAVLAGAADLAVHSLKDLPTAASTSSGGGSGSGGGSAFGGEANLTLAAVPPRGDVRDALVSLAGPLAALPAGAVVGTGSPRRAAQLVALRPDLQVVDLRGNVDSRIAAVDRAELAGVVLAAAGLHRLGRGDRITQTFTSQQMLPAPGQGALAVECRAGDDEMLALAAGLDDPDTRAAVTAERSVLHHLQAGCHAPVGALATVALDQILLDAAVFDAHGQSTVFLSVSGAAEAAAELGERASQQLFTQGAGRLVGTVR